MTKKPKKIVLVNGNIEVEGGGKLTQCRDCGRDVRFGKVLSTGKWMIYENDRNHTAHWANCHHAHKFRKQRTYKK